MMRKSILLAFILGLSSVLFSFSTQAESSCGNTVGLNNQITKLPDAQKQSFIDQLVATSSKIVQETDTYTVYDLIDPSTGEKITQELQAKPGYKKVFRPATASQKAGYDIVNMNDLKAGRRAQTQCEGCCNGFCGNCGEKGKYCDEVSICPDGSLPPCKTPSIVVTPMSPVN